MSENLRWINSTDHKRINRIVTRSEMLWPPRAEILRSTYTWATVRAYLTSKNLNCLLTLRIIKTFPRHSGENFSGNF
jgi:hypothetical protein